MTTETTPTTTTTTPATTRSISAAVETALDALKIEGIEGWGLNNPDPDLFNEIEAAPPQGCMSATCQHVSHGYAAPTVRLLPRAGTLYRVAGAEDRAESMSTWFALVSPSGDTTYYHLAEPRSDHAYVRLGTAADVPAWALARLGVQADQPVTPDARRTSLDILSASRDGLIIDMVTVKQPGDGYTPRCWSHLAGDQCADEQPSGVYVEYRRSNGMDDDEPLVACTACLAAVPAN